MIAADDTDIFAIDKFCRPVSQEIHQGKDLAMNPVRKYPTTLWRFTSTHSVCRTNRKPAWLCTILAASLLVLTVGCAGHKNPVGLTTPPVSFSMSSIPNTDADGNPTIDFYAMPSEDIFIQNITVVTPLNGVHTIVKNQAVPKGTAILCNDDGMTWTKISGTWTFSFGGSKSTGDLGGFSISSTLKVGAE
jgi:hypothetical protein